MSNSFSLLRTNVGLTTNIKIMIDSNYKLSLDSIESDPSLSYNKYKKVNFSKDNYYDELIPYFYSGLPAETAFIIKYENDAENMSSDFKNQYDELYNYGARNIIDNKNYTEEYEYFAPLYVNKDGLPKKFIIFRVDGSGVGSTIKENFKTDIIKKLKTVKIFDLTKETALGEWLDKNITSNSYFPDSPLDIDFRSLEFCRWNGIDFDNGGYTYKSLFIDDMLDEEKEIFTLEKFVFDSYRNNKVVFPNILNLSFLFDDNPSTPDIKRKWSINRYYGFYLDDMEIVKTISPYIPIKLKDDVVIVETNILYSPSDSNPFVQDWTTDKPFYIEYNGIYYLVEQYTETLTNQLIKVDNTTTVTNDTTTVSKKTQSAEVKKYTSSNKVATEQYGDVIIYKYRIISDINLTGLTSNDLNNNFGQIETITNRLIDADNNDIVIDEFDNQDGNIGVWMIEVDGIIHSLIKNNDSYIINTDYTFIFNNATASSINDYSYKVAGETTKVSTVVDFNNVPKKFTIYKAKFTDVKDFDTRIVDTDYSKYEYEESTNLTKTDETKMYVENLASTSNPIELDDFIYKNDVVHIPVASEYTANYETFKIDSNSDLSDIWRKNSVYCRWGFQKSLSANDLPYLLNNSLIFEDYNRTTNNYEASPKRMERNLDYFYTINSGSASYTHHSLHIEKLDNDKNIDTNFKFDLGKYLNIAPYNGGTYSYDYFTYLFSKKSEFLNGTIFKNTNKYSLFNIGDSSVPNHTLFRGLRFDIYESNGISLDSNNNLSKINIKPSNFFNNYKFSILLTDNKDVLEFNDITQPNKVTGITQSNSTFNGIVIKDWTPNSTYNSNDVVIYDDILYSGTQSNYVLTTVVNDNVIPTNPVSQGLQFYPSISQKTIFWSPVHTYTVNYTSHDGICYNFGEYYKISDISSPVDFWNPVIVNSTGYNLDDIVLYKGLYYISTSNNNSSTPGTSLSNWNITTKPSFTKWSIVNIWEQNKTYPIYSYIVYSNVLYISTSNTDQQHTPDKSSVWLKVHSFNADNTSTYVLNDVIYMNNSYYLTTGNSTLNNGITIYINNTYKNILININIGDNTLINLSNSNRDLLYNDLYKKLTASNFSNAINDVVNKYSFINDINYIVINNNDIRKYSINNITNLPYYINCVEPDKLDIKVNSLYKNPIPLLNTLNPVNRLNDGFITDITSLNYYNNIPIAANIIENQFEPKVFEIYHGNKNILSNEIFRYSGYYSPVFYTVDLFEVDEYNLGNYKFDTSLTDFGIMKERKISKINRSGSILKLANSSDEKSIYPMLDEFGYSVYNFFIFSSSWDLKYYLETVSLAKTSDYLQRYTIDENIVNNLTTVNIPISIPNDIGININNS